MIKISDQAAKYEAFGFQAIDDGDEINLAEEIIEKEDEEAKEPLWKNPKKVNRSKDAIRI